MKSTANKYIIQCRLVKHSSDYSRTAPVRCFHLTALVLSGEEHLTSAKHQIIKRKQY